MLKSFNNFLDYLSLKIVMQGNQDTRYLFITRLILISIAITISYIGFYLIYGVYELIAISSVFLLIFGHALLLLKNDKLQNSRIYFVTAVNINLLLTSLLAGPSTGIFYFFFPTAAGSLIVFEPHERKLKNFLRFFLYSYFHLFN